MDSALKNPILRKVITGVTGLGLTLFVIGHMVGNLTFFAGPDAYNHYAYALLSFGPIFYAVEIGLLAFVAFHIVVGTSIAMRRRAARPIDYDTYKSAGDPSLQTRSSRSMIYTGLILMVFIVFHLWSFKYGPGVEQGYVTTVDGIEMRDLYRLMVERFQGPIYTFGYVAVLLLLAVHLRHGVWSAIQSLGAISPRMTPIVYATGLVLGLLIAAGFIVPPLYIFILCPGGVCP